MYSLFIKPKAIAAVAIAASALASSSPTTASALQIPIPKPDLVVAATTPTTVTVKNIAAPSLYYNTNAGSFDVHVPAGSGPWNSTPVIDIRVGSLRAGQSVTLTVPALCEVSRPAYVDYLNQVSEANESNNTGSIPGMVC